jgi:hypothetical protein
MSDDLAALRAQIEQQTGIPAAILGGDTKEEILRTAELAAEWKASFQPPPPATAAVPAAVVSHASSGSPLDGRIVGPPQVLSRSELAAMTPADRMAAWRSGRLATMLGGASPYPPPGRMT